jgi:hypothetical protein
VTEMRPDPDSDLAGEESEYGDDTGFAAEATRTASPDVNTADAAPTPDGDPGATATDSAGLTAEDDELGNGAD